MAIIKNVEIYYAQVDPKRPNTKLNKERPSWDMQIRTKDKKQAEEWRSLKLNVKTIMKEGDDGIPVFDYFRVNLRKPAKAKDGTAKDPVKVMDGQKNPVDPKTIGNGSIVNIRVYQYEGKRGDEDVTVSVPMAIQLVKHIVYHPKKGDFEEFDEVSTETIDTVQEMDDSETESF